MKDFFISYNQADHTWAEWIAWTLEEAGYSVIFQLWDFRPGSNFVLEMHRATQEAKTTIAVLSENYLNAKYTQAEWAAAFMQDPDGKKHTLIPVVVANCEPSGLLGSIVYVDLVNQSGPKARKKLFEALENRAKPDQAPKFPSTSGRVAPNKVGFPGKLWMVPYQRNNYFTGRGQVLSDLYKYFTQGSTAALSQTQAISGLGGIGKTQTAVEYAHLHRQDYQAVFWVRSETNTEINTGFADIAEYLDLPQKDAQDSSYMIAAVKRWLEQNSGWLLIFDNADDPKLLKPFLPRVFQGHILLTSRAQVFGVLGITRPIALEKMEPEQAQSFLFKRTGQEPNDPAEKEAARQLATELGYLPLALEQAGAYIHEQQACFQEYLASYSQRHLSLLEQIGPVAGDYSASVATTWEINFQQVEEKSLASADLLRASSFFAPDGIPYELILKGANQLGDAIASALADHAKDPLVLNELLSPLFSYSLIRLEPGNKKYSTYRLVQEVVKASLDEDCRRLWAERFVRALAQILPKAGEHSNWQKCNRLLAQAQLAVQIIQELDLDFEEAALLLLKTGYCLRDRGHYSSAEPLLRQALEVYKNIDKEHLSIATSYNGLAVLYNNQGRYSEAEPRYQLALDLYQRLLGQKHISVATTLNNLAVLYNNQGRYNKAEEYYLQALNLYKSLLGEEHPFIATSLNNLAGIYSNQGRYSEAEYLYLKALDLYKCLLGNQHPCIATSLNNLAELYDHQGRYSEAEKRYKQALELGKKLLGEEHPLIAISLNNLAGLYDNQGRYNEAEKLYLQALQLSKKILNYGHPLIETIYQNLDICRQHITYQTSYTYSEVHSKKWTNSYLPISLITKIMNYFRELL